MQELNGVEVEQVAGGAIAETIAELTEPHTVFNHDRTRPPQER